MLILVSFPGVMELYGSAVVFPVLKLDAFSAYAKFKTDRLTKFLLLLLRVDLGVLPRS